MSETKIVSETIEIVDLSHDGRGIGRAPLPAAGNQKVCFIAGALPGEIVRWRRTNSKRSFDEGEVIDVVQPSPDRVLPKCQYIGECGGCELQHLDSSAQLTAKEAQLKRAFARDGIGPQSEDAWLPPLAGHPWEYRRRTRLAVVYAGKKPIVGYRKRSSRNIVSVKSCLVLEPALNHLLPKLDAQVAGLKKFGLSQIELTTDDSSSHAAVCLSVKSRPDDQSFENLKTFCDQESIQLWCREGKNEAQPLGDYSPLQTQLDESLSMQFTPAQFVQTNAEMNCKMIAQAMQLLDVQSEHRVLDLFCGAGNFSLPIAKRAEKMIGMEGMARLIAQADINAQRQSLDNAEFRVADLSKEEALSGKSFAKGSFDRILLDPPRSGAKNLMPALLNIGASKIVYISCHPATMVRDIGILTEGGYQVTKAGVIDMFPQTTHLEAMALLELRD